MQKRRNKRERKGDSEIYIHITYLTITGCPDPPRQDKKFRKKEVTKSLTYQRQLDRTSRVYEDDRNYTTIRVRSITYKMKIY